MSRTETVSARKIIRASTFFGSEYRSQGPSERMRTESLLLIILFLGWNFAVDAQNAPLNRTIPTALTSHPGNVFLRGETVSIDLPEKNDWTLYDYSGRRIRKFKKAARASMQGLPTGFYRFKSSRGEDWISLAVLEPLKAPTPATSPISLDIAMAWLYPVEKMDQVANLCSLAGANWVRDRVHWEQMEPTRGHFSDANRHDNAMEVQKRHGFQILTVVATCPKWANPIQRRFPLDLRDAYRFAKSLAERWQGQMAAFEPWNEAEFRRFGGHTGAEIASYQKAAFLGLKAGNSNAIACLSPFITENPNILRDLEDNIVWPYFDTYNIHHYSPPEELEGVYEAHRPLSAGRPMWVTEAGILQEWTEFWRTKELSGDDLKIQAECVAKLFAASLHGGSMNTFYFLLPHYSEQEILWGLLRPDLTPRPSYVAFAAVGRLLSDARAIGKIRNKDDSIRAFLFSAKPDGIDRQVIVAWTTNRTARLRLEQKPEQTLDMFGRRKTSRKSIRLTQEPTFVVLAPGKGNSLEIDPSPVPAGLGPQAERSPVVMQTTWPEDKADLDASAYRIQTDQKESIPLWIYNFSDEERSGSLEIEATHGWRAEVQSEMKLRPMSRTAARLTVKAPHSSSGCVGSLRIIGRFDPGGQIVASIRLLPGDPTGAKVRDGEQ